MEFAFVSCAISMTIFSGILSKAVINVFLASALSLMVAKFTVPGGSRKYTCADEYLCTWNQMSSGQPYFNKSSFSYLSFPMYTTYFGSEQVKKKTISAHRARAGTVRPRGRALARPPSNAADRKWL